MLCRPSRQAHARRIDNDRKRKSGDINGDINKEEVLVLTTEFNFNYRVHDGVWISCRDLQLGLVQTPVLITSMLSPEGNAGICAVNAIYLYNGAYLRSTLMDYSHLIPDVMVGNNVWFLANKPVEITAQRQRAQHWRAQHQRAQRWRAQRRQAQRWQAQRRQAQRWQAQCQQQRAQVSLRRSTHGQRARSSGGVSCGTRIASRSSSMLRSPIAMNSTTWSRHSLDVARVERRTAPAIRMCSSGKPLSSVMISFDACTVVELSRRICGRGARATVRMSFPPRRGAS